MSERISKILEKWSLSEPALTSIYYTHKLMENSQMDCDMRVGKRTIEFNPELINFLSDPALEEKLKATVLRICLRHPYERQPYGCPPNILKAASDLVISPIYNLKFARLYSPEDFGLEKKQHFEWYAHKLMENVKDEMQKIFKKMGASNKSANNQSNAKDDGGNQKSDQGTQPEGGDGPAVSQPNSHDEPLELATRGGRGDGNQSPLERLAEASGAEAELWEEDDEMLQTIKERIEQITSWGSVPHNIQEAILVAQQGRIDYRKVFRSFSTSIVSTTRKFTRMRPNRRLGYKALGSKHDMASRLLVAVDVSGSVLDKAFAKFFRIITHFFKFGIEAADVIQFDCSIKKEVLSLDKACEKTKSFKRMGNGGTDFQIVFDYYHQHRDYDALIIFTDGYAPVPKEHVPPRSKLLWVIDTEDNYNKKKDDLSPLGRICFIM